MSQNRPQYTIAESVRIGGIGYITGADVNLEFKPAEPGAGRVFVRSDLPDPVRLPASVRSLAPRSRRTSLRNGSAGIEMIEHVLAALGGLQIDNCTIEVDAAETPGLDGSSLPIVEALERAGKVAQDVPRKRYEIEKPIYLRDGEAYMVACPAEENDAGLTISYHLDYGERSPIPQQTKTVRLTSGTFARELAGSRTFLLTEEAEELRREGLGKRTTAKDLLIFTADGVMENQLRFPDECVRHKILDLVGDLALLDFDVAGHIHAHKSGHQLNRQLVEKLATQMRRREADRMALREPVIDINKIAKILPHRYPFLLIDKVIEVEGEVRAVGIKNVTYNEPYFQGHWPGRPVMPGVLQVEAIAQLAGVLLSRKLEHTGQLAMILSMDNVKIRRPVLPGDQLRIEVEALKVKTRTADIYGRAMVGDKVACEANMRFVLVDADSV